MALSENPYQVQCWNCGAIYDTTVYTDCPDCGVNQEDDPQFE